MALIAGTLNNASGVRPNTKIILTAYKTTSDVVTLAPDTTIVTSATGAYSFECKPSFYNVRIQQPGYPCENVGIIQVYSDSVDGTINDFLTTFKPDDLTPEILKQCIAAMEGAEAAQKAAESAASTAAEETAQKVGLMYPVNAGNWSTVAGSQLTEVDRYKAWSYPDNSSDRYAVRGSVTLPITIPAAPDANWYLASSVNPTEMRTDSASQLGLVYKKDWQTGDAIPVDAMKDKLTYWYNGQFYSVGTDTGFTSNDFDADLVAGKFVSSKIVTDYNYYKKMGFICLLDVVVGSSVGVRHTLVEINGVPYPLSRPVSGIVESITYGKTNNYGEMVVSGVKTYLLDIKYFDAQRYDARAFGAVGDYYENTPLHECGQELNNWYNECCSLDKPMIIVGDYYSEKGLVWSNNLGLHKRRNIEAAASINFDLKDGSKIGLYTGYDHAFGIYHQQVTGILKINYVGADNNGLTGFYIDKGAYGDYGIVPSGWDIGYHNHGSIGCIIKGAKEKTSANNLDVLIESTEASPGILRFSCNIFTIEDVTLTSQCKLRIIVGNDVPDITATSGGLFKFTGVNFEGKQGNGKFGSVFHIVRTGEVKVTQAMDVVHFTQCWFEGFDETKIFMNLIYSKVQFGLQCFFAKSAKERFIQVNDDFCGVTFDGAYAYFADYLPQTKCMVSRTGTATDKYRSAVVAKNSVFYGPSGTAVPLHDGQVLALNHIRTTSSGGQRFMVSRWQQAYPASGATDDYLTNMSLNIKDHIDSVVGTGWSKAEIVLDGGTGSTFSSVVIKVTKNGFYIDHDSTGLLTIVGDNLVFPTSVKAAFFKPTVTISAYCDIDNMPVV